MKFYIYSLASGVVQGGPYSSKEEAEADLARIDRGYRSNRPWFNPNVVAVAVGDENYTAPSLKIVKA